MLRDGIDPDDYDEDDELSVEISFFQIGCETHEIPKWYRTCFARYISNDIGVDVQTSSEELLIALHDYRQSMQAAE